MSSAYINVLHSNKINNKCFAILINWLIKIIENYDIADDSNRALCLACYILDNVTSRIFIPKDKIQLYGITSLFIASKYECDYSFAMTTAMASALTDDTYTIDEIRLTELEILSIIDYQIPRVIAYDLIFQYYTPLTKDVYEDDVVKIATYVLNAIAMIYVGAKRLKHKYIAILSLLIATNVLEIKYDLPHIDGKIYSDLAHIELSLSKLLKTKYKHKGSDSKMTNRLKKMLYAYMKDVDGITLKSKPYHTQELLID
jgi:hypothetical protein